MLSSRASKTMFFPPCPLAGPTQAYDSGEKASCETESGRDPRPANFEIHVPYSRRYEQKSTDKQNHGGEPQAIWYILASGRTGGKTLRTNLSCFHADGGHVTNINNTFRSIGLEREIAWRQTGKGGFFVQFWTGSPAWPRNPRSSKDRLSFAPMHA